MAVKKSGKKTVKTRKAAVKKSLKKTSKKSCKCGCKKRAKRTMAARKGTSKKTVKTAVIKTRCLAKKPCTKGEIYRAIGEYAGITRKQVQSVFAALEKLIESHLKKGAIGLLKLEGLLKIERIFKPAKKAKKGINPFTGEEMMFKAKPAHHVIKIRALKKLKEMV